LGEALRVVVNMLRGHAAAAAAIRGVNPSLSVGIVHQLRIFEPASRSKQDVAVAALYDYLFNGALLGALATGRIGPPFTSGIQVRCSAACLSQRMCRRAMRYPPGDRLARSTRKDYIARCVVSRVSVGRSTLRRRASQTPTMTNGQASF
jgi:hypothetical protein